MPGPKNKARIVEAPRGSFNMRAFKALSKGPFARDVSLDTFLDYAEMHLKEIGKGTARVAFVYSSRLVLKVALNAAGIAQNETEVSVYTSTSAKKLVTQIHDFDDDYRWIIAEIVRPVYNKRELYDMVGIKFGIKYGMKITFRDVVRAAAEDDREYVTFDMDEPTKHKVLQFMEDLHELMIENDLEPGDIEVPEHWGKTADGRLVLLDYGLTADILQAHYQNQEPP